MTFDPSRMTYTPDVLFVRTPINAAPKVTEILRNLYRAGWVVVSHSESGGEYTFVLEGGVMATPEGAQLTNEEKDAAKVALVKRTLTNAVESMMDRFDKLGETR